MAVFTGLLVFCIFVWLATIWTEVGVSLLVFVYIWQAAALVAPPLISAGANVYPTDLVIIVTAMASLPRLLIKKLDISLILVMLANASVLISLSRGVFASGLQAATNEQRWALQFWVFALYCSSGHIKANHLNRFAKVLLSLALGLSAVACLRWLGSPLVAATGDWGRQGAVTYGGLRAINAEQTLILCEGILVLLTGFFVRKNLLMLVTGSCLFILVAVLQHRTDWIVVVLGLSSVFLIMIRSGMRRLLSRPFWALILLATATLGLFFATGLSQSLSKTLSGTVSSRSTFSWRTTGWEEIMSEFLDHPIVDLIIGEPAGSGFGRVVNGHFVNVSTHSFYIDTLVRMGLIGLIVLVSTFSLAAANLWRMAHSSEWQPFVTLSTFGLLVSIAVFSFAYDPDIMQGALLGVLIGFGAGCRTLQGQYSNHRFFELGKHKFTDLAPVNLSSGSGSLN